jgi:hypothetical protein
LFDDDDEDANPISSMNTVLTEYPELKNRIIPYVGGEEINAATDLSADRYAIYLSDIQSETELSNFGPLVKFVEARVKPERTKLGNNPNNVPLKRRWWAYQAHRPQLYSLLKTSKFAVCNSQVSKHLAFARYPSNYIFAHTVCVVPALGEQIFAVLQSRIHEIWARFFSSTLEDRLRYAPSDCFETFPFPVGYESEPALEGVGQTYHDHRAALMVAANEGMTKTYNRFHKSEEKKETIQRLRELHDELDRAVLGAYGWDDLAAELRPKFLTEETENDHAYQNRYFWPAEGRDRVLARLLVLNAERHAAEVAEGRAPAGLTQARDAENEDGEPQLDLS